MRMNYDFIGGSWQVIAESVPAIKNRFDVILMSETLYNVKYYD